MKQKIPPSCFTPPCLAIFFIFFLFPCLRSCDAAQDASSAALHLIPEPKQVQVRHGRFLITPKTRILIGAAHSHEDRVIAEILVRGIETVTGKKIPIALAKGHSQTENTISLLRLDDPSALRSFFALHRLSTSTLWGAQGYQLETDRKRIVILSSAGQGLFYGAQTLLQLFIPDARHLSCPAVTIMDWPSMQWRGVHIDISRGPIPTLEYMKKEIRALAEYKINLFALYMEEVFNYRSQPLLNRKDGVLSASEIKDLVEYAKKYYITILPEQQAFGHLHHLLKYETYGGLAETPHGHVLTPVNEKSYDLIKSMYSELAPLFPGPFLHIGADETFELGAGQSKSLAERIGLGRLYLQHLQKVYEAAKPFHKQLLFWGDIAVKSPDLLGLLPKDMIAVPWGYDLDTDYEGMIKPYKEAGLRFIVSPGASNWNRIWPNLNIAFANIRDFVDAGQKYGAMGMLNTTWNDDGEALLDMSWPALIFGASSSWQQGGASTEAFKTSYDWAFYRNQDHVFYDVLEQMNRAHALLQSVGLEDAEDEAFWTDPFTKNGTRYIEKALPIAHDLRLSAEYAMESLNRNRYKARVHADTIDDLFFAAMRLDLLGMKIQYIDEMNRFYWDAYQHQKDRSRVVRDLEEITATNGRLEDLRDDTARLRRSYSEAWARENRPFWIENVLVRYDNLEALYQVKIQAIRAIIRDFYEHSSLPLPEENGFLLKPRP